MCQVWRVLGITLKITKQKHRFSSGPFSKWAWSFLTSHVPGSSSPFCIVLGVRWRTVVFPHSNCWYLRSRCSLHGHQWVTCQSVLNIYVLSDTVLGTRNVMVNKTQSLTWKVYTGCRGKKINKNTHLQHRGSLPWWAQAWEHGRGGRGSTDLALGMWIGGWGGVPREVSIRKLFQASIWKSY